MFPQILSRHFPSPPVIGYPPRHIVVSRPQKSLNKIYVAFVLFRKISRDCVLQKQAGKLISNLHSGQTRHHRQWRETASFSCSSSSTQLTPRQASFLSGDCELKEQDVNTSLRLYSLGGATSGKNEASRSRSKQKQSNHTRFMQIYETSINDKHSAKTTRNQPSLLLSCQAIPTALR